MNTIIPFEFDIWSSLLAFGVFQGLFMIFVLYGYGRSLSIHLLAGLLTILVLSLLNYLLISSNLFTHYPHLLHTTIPLLFLIGPIYYGYVSVVVAPPLEIRYNLWPHFVPFLIAIVFMLPFYMLNAEQKIALIDTQKELRFIPLSFPTFFFMASQIVHSFTYVFYANSLIKRSTSDNTPASKAVKFNWFKKFGQAFMLYWAVDFSALSIYSIAGRINQEVSYITMLCTTLIINVLVYFAIKNNKEFSQSLVFVKKYKNSALSQTDSKKCLDNVIEVMREQKPYLDTELSLSKLAQLTGTSSHQISQVLNTELGKSFYDFINEFRYEEAKYRLQQKEYKHLTILAIALESGFTNKNTFNKVFKKHSGLTPSEYLRKVAI